MWVVVDVLGDRRGCLWAGDVRDTAEGVVVVARDLSSGIRQGGHGSTRVVGREARAAVRVFDAGHPTKRVADMAKGVRGIQVGGGRDRDGIVDRVDLAGGLVGVEGLIRRAALVAGQDRGRGRNGRRTLVHPDGSVPIEKLLPEAPVAVLREDPIEGGSRARASGLRASGATVVHHLRAIGRRRQRQARERIVDKNRCRRGRFGIDAQAVEIRSTHRVVGLPDDAPAKSRCCPRP